MITLWKGIYIFNGFLRRNDIKDHYTRRENITVEEIPFEVLICFFDIFLPILGILLNIRTVNFRKYLKSLMKGLGKEKYFLEASIFV